MKVLIVDDDPDVVEALTLAFDLLQPQCAVFEAHSGESAVKIFYRERPDLVVLDIMLPDMDGYQVLHRIRHVSDVPVIMLTVKEEEIDKVRALGIGADDYIVKPFGVLELLARIKAIQRRLGMRPEVTESAPLVCGDLRIDLVERQVSVADREVKLTPTEYGVLVCLARDAGRVVTSKTLLTSVWGPEYGDDLNCLKVCIQRLRGKLEKDHSRRGYIVTERGVGYRLVTPD
ncbi:MAG: response regulator transcription factor [Dehalococcoidia bacterium]|nr:MAG: response regulator transcription factor [Dehalococcoidia bacterium]